MLGLLGYAYLVAKLGRVPEEPSSEGAEASGK